MKIISGFSKFSKDKKIDYLFDNFINSSDSSLKGSLKSFWHNDENVQELIDKFSENTISNYYFPYGVIPNVMINGKIFCVPMVIEESSVVAAASRSAKYWITRGGFNSKVISTKKRGQIHFIWRGESKKLFHFFERVKASLAFEASNIVRNMELRGGGITGIDLIDKTSSEPNYYQIEVSFETCDAMGANFINSVLESFAETFKEKIKEASEFSGLEQDVEIIMSILSNYTPECIVETSIECPIEDLTDGSFGIDAFKFADKFARAIRISKIDVSRATTHNKGIFNGVDGVVLATGNDFRAVEACGHTFASRDGSYKGLTDIDLSDGTFHFSIKLPIALGTVGGLTSLHPMAKFSLDMLGRPSANELMQIASTVGLAQNFAAIRSLVTTGIQKGHMKMHLINILNQLNADQEEHKDANAFFIDKVISFGAVRDFLNNKRV